MSNRTVPPEQDAIDQVLKALHSPAIHTSEGVKINLPHTLTLINMGDAKVTVSTSCVIRAGPIKVAKD